MMLARNVSPEWERLKLLRSHRHRLVNKPKYRPLDEKQLQLDPKENALNNDLELVENGIRHILRRNDLDLLLNTGLDTDTDGGAQTSLESLCLLLEQAVNEDLLSSTPKESREQATSSSYAKLDALLHILADTQWQFEVVAGATTSKLLKLKSLEEARRAKEIVDDINTFFTKLTRPTVQDSRLPDQIRPIESVDTNDQYDPLMAALSGLTTLLSKLNTLPGCRHKVLLQLLREDAVIQCQGLSGLNLDLFLSDCELPQWQWSLFNSHISIDQRLWQRASKLCGEIQDAYECSGDLHLAYSDNDIFVRDDNTGNATRIGSLAGSKPSKTLKQLLKDYAFAPDMIRIPGSKTLFQKREKRALAASLVFSLATSVNSGPVVKCWDAESIYFLSSRNGDLLQGVPYALCIPQGDLLESADFKTSKQPEQSIEDVIFPRLAKLLMEIECGFELSHIETDFRTDGNSKRTTLEDVIYEELAKDLGRESYLEAVKACLKFRATYERRAKHMRQREGSDDSFTAARRITYANIIKNIQGSCQTDPRLKRSRDASDNGDLAHDLPPISSDDDRLGISNGVSSQSIYDDSPIRYLQPPMPNKNPAVKKVKFMDEQDNGQQFELPFKPPIVDLERKQLEIRSSKTSLSKTLHLTSITNQSVPNPPQHSTQSHTHENYSVGWICALPIEMAACTAMLDEIHHELGKRPSDQNIYTLGKIGRHNVVIACLPAGVYGTTSAATVAMDMISSFPKIRIRMMVGISGGIPSKKYDIRLGDVIVSKPTGQNAGVLQHDMGKSLQGSRFSFTGTLNKPPQLLLNAVSKLQAEHLLNKSKVSDYLASMEQKLGDMWSNFKPPDRQSDRLFKSDYTHIDPNDDTCSKCTKEMERIRTTRQSDNPKIHYGAIASGNQVIRDSVTRDRLAEQGILCLEMESAGLMDRFPCLVIRGVCDYADSHKNKQWQGYAAAMAAACAKEILSVI